MVEQLCVNGFTLYKYMCNEKSIIKNDFIDTDLP